MDMLHPMKAGAKCDYESVYWPHWLHISYQPIGHKRQTSLYSVTAHSRTPCRVIDPL